MDILSLYIRNFKNDFSNFISLVNLVHFFSLLCSSSLKFSWLSPLQNPWGKITKGFLSYSSNFGNLGTSNFLLFLLSPQLLVTNHEFLREISGSYHHFRRVREFRGWVSNLDSKLSTRVSSHIIFLFGYIFVPRFTIIHSYEANFLRK